MSQIFDSCFTTPGKMMPLDEARALLREKITPVTKIEQLPLRQCCGKLLADDVVAQCNVPPHDNSAMDGYAIKYDDLSDERDIHLDVIARIPAGHFLNQTVKSGEAVRIFTGAPVPDGVDTIVMQENAQEKEGKVTLSPGAAPKKGVNLRKAGEDIKVGDVILEKGRVLRAADIGICASIGKTDLPVYTPLKVALFSTGDEIIDAGQPLRDGAVYDINRYTVFAMLEKLGCTVTDLGILPDDPATITDALEKAAGDHDLLFTSGGVSMGEEDHVKTAIAQLGEINFWRIAIKPGRPIALGEVKGAAFIGLPGNPVATLVTFMTIARPLICGMSGRTDQSTRKYKIPAGFSYQHKGGRYEWQRAYLKETPYGPVVELFHTTGSGILTSMVKTDGLVEINDNAQSIEPGDLVDFIPYSEVSQ